MTRQCERPDCAVRASVAYGFDARRRTAWFANLSALPGEEAMAGALCASHARAMVLPRGWWLDDRRDGAVDRLFVTSSGAEADRVDHAAPLRRPDRQHRTRRRVPVTATWVEVPLPLDEAASGDPATGERDAATVLHEPAARTSGDHPADQPADQRAGQPADHPDAQPAGPPADDAVSGAGVTHEPVGDGSTERVVVPWRPRFDQSDDLDGVLAARSPLLARAFSGLRRSAPRPTRDE